MEIGWDFNGQSCSIWLAARAAEGSCAWALSPPRFEARHRLEGIEVEAGDFSVAAAPGYRPGVVIAKENSRS